MSENKLKIEDIVAGKGKEVTSGDYVTIHYSGTLENGKKFDSSYDRDEPFQTRIGVGEVIEGWDMGVVGMKAGGKETYYSVLVSLWGQSHWHNSSKFNFNL